MNILVYSWKNIPFHARMCVSQMDRILNYEQIVDKIFWL